MLFGGYGCLPGAGFFTDAAGLCAGDRFYNLARDAFGDRVIHSAVGMRFVFGA